MHIARRGEVLYTAVPGQGGSAGRVLAVCTPTNGTTRPGTHAARPGTHAVRQYGSGLSTAVDSVRQWPQYGSGFSTAMASVRQWPQYGNSLSKAVASVRN